VDADELISNPEFFSNPKAAKYIDITPGTLAVWRSTGRFAIPFFRIGSKIRYRKSDLDAFLASRRVDPAKRKPKQRKRVAK
jgi:hypothetical protein